MSIYNQRFGPYALQPYGVTMPFQSLSSGPPVIPNVVTPTTVNDGQVKPPGMVKPSNPWMGHETSGMGQSHERNIREGEMMGRGYADLSFGNLGQMVGTGLGFMGGMGPVLSMGKYGLSQFGIGDNPFREYEGFGLFDKDLVDAVKAGTMTRGQAMNAKNEREAGKRGATDSRSGQVRGGGTGSRSGGLTAGGPR